jgi:hypothetical protein
MSRAIIVARISRLPWRRSLEYRVSCVAIATRTSTGVACSPTLEVPPPRGFGDAAACSHKGPAVARPLDRGTAATTPDRGTSATARRGNVVAATGLETPPPHNGTAVARPLDRGPPPLAWEPSPLLRIEELPPPHVEVGEPRPPQPLVGGPPPCVLSGNRRR